MTVIVTGNAIGNVIMIMSVIMTVIVIMTEIVIMIVIVIVSVIVVTLFIHILIVMIEDMTDLMKDLSIVLLKEIKIVTVEIGKNVLSTLLTNLMTDSRQEKIDQTQAKVISKTDQHIKVMSKVLGKNAFHQAL